MKNKFKFLTFVFVVSLIFISSSCSDDDDSTLLLSSTSLNLIVNEEQSVNIVGGSGDFTIAVVYPELNDNSLKRDSVVSIRQDDRKVILQGLSVGEAMVVVLDNKNIGSQATLLVVVKDPYIEEKKDATARFSWNDITKKSGVDAGEYVFSYADKIGQFKWVGDEKNSITFTFEYKKEISAKKVKTTPKSFGQLTIVRNGEKTKRTLLNSAIVFQVQSAVEGENNTVWVAFNIDGKDGICVAKFAE